MHVDLFDCEKQLVPGVTLHLRLSRFTNNTMFFMKGTDDEANALDGKVQAIIGKAFYVRKIVLADSVKLSIEKTLVQSSAIYPYIESLNKNFVL